MKFEEALRIINKPKGYVVRFTLSTDNGLITDQFPDNDELMIPTFKEAVDLGRRFKEAMEGRIKHIEIVDQDCIEYELLVKSYSIDGVERFNATDVMRGQEEAKRAIDNNCNIK